MGLLKKSKISSSLDDKTTRGGIHRRELIVIKWLRSKDPGFLARNFLFS
jgi:hypothetical protein